MDIYAALTGQNWAQITAVLFSLFYLDLFFIKAKLTRIVTTSIKAAFTTRNFAKSDHLVPSQ